MVVFYLRNSRIPDSKIVPVTVSLDLDVVKNEQFPATGTGFPNKVDPEGEQIWLLILSTTEPDSSGNPIIPEIINNISEDTIHLEIEAALGRIGQQINWGTLLSDTQAPQVVEITPPLNQTTGVSIFSNIIARLEDPLPAAGIDLSTINISINDISIMTNGVAQLGEDISLLGNVFDLTIVYRPKRDLS